MLSLAVWLRTPSQMPVPSLTSWSHASASGSDFISQYCFAIGSLSKHRAFEKSRYLSLPRRRPYMLHNERTRSHRAKSRCPSRRDKAEGCLDFARHERVMG